ncbi:MAG TPA: TonB-dependent receptor, partial [Steroidobacteraceae bacterium]|nr:TonB-dependent receptor [Steroidobacteraceae bacterium]
HILAHHQDIVGWKGTSNATPNGTPTYLACANYAVAPTGSGCASVGAGATGNSLVPSWYPQDMAMYLERTDSRRKDGRVSVQWRPNDSVLVTVDDNYASDDERSDRFQRSTWFGSFSDVRQDANGTITSFTTDGGNAPTDFNSFIATDYIVTNTPGLNVVWDLADTWTAELDADQSVSKLNPNGGYTDIDADTGFGSNDAVGTNNASFGLTLNQNPNVLPFWSAYGPNAVASGSGAVAGANYTGLNPFIIGSHVIPLQSQRNTDKVNQVKLDATWHTGSTKVNFGAQFVDDSWNSYELDTFDFTGSNNYWQLWSGYGPANNSFEFYCPVAGGGTAPCPDQHNPGAGATRVQHGVALPSSLFTAVNLGTWMPGFSGGGNLPAQMVEYNPYSVLSYLETQPPNADWNPTSGFPRYTGGVPAMGLNAGGVQRVDRKNYSPFVTAEHNFELGDMTLKANAGLRWQKTDVTIQGFAKPVVSVGLQPGDPTAYAFNLGTSTLTTATNSYKYFLPSLDLNLLVRPDLKVRADFSRTETPTTNTNIIPNTTFGGRVNALSATGNNPGLLPYLSDNYDLGAEWYYASNDYVSVDGFFKHVTQFPVSSISSVTLPINDPSPRSANFGKPMVFAETSFTNGEAANVTGLELTWQQMLFGGFGYQINGTYAHTNKNFDNHSLTNNQFALPGVGNSANLIAFYQAHGLQARLAVQWQASYLLTDSGQEQGGGAFGNEPVYLDSSTEVDFSSTYDISSHLSAYFEALNLTDTVYHTYGRFKNQTLNLVDYGRSYTVGVRAKF